MTIENDHVNNEKVSVDPEQFAKAKSELERRCKKSSINLTEEKDLFDKTPYLLLDLPSGRETRPIILEDLSEIENLLSIPFEKYVFLNPYDAICSYKDGLIEGLVSSVERVPFSYVKKRLLLREKVEGEEEEELNLELKSSDGSEKISLSPASSDFKILVPRARRPNMSLKIEGIKVSRHDDARSILTRLADSLFFQIDLSFNVALTLFKARRPPLAYRRRLRIPGSLDDLKYPSQEYDDAPMSLYWYARSAMGMPLLQFLAYYQAIEFYFPTYFRAEARRKVRRILKDPMFRPDRDADIGRILTSLSTKSGSIGDERAMMRATLQECIDPAELRSFLTSGKAKEEFFSSKTKGLTTYKLPLANPSVDLRNDVADRLYDIRCKIVHTKSDTGEGEIELLLPFSKEAEQLYFDIDLIQYLARQVLITASTLLQIE